MPRVTLFSALVLPFSFIGLMACSNPTVQTDRLIVERPILNAEGRPLGLVTLTDLGADGTQVTVKISGIAEGAHAMHFHEFGKCDAPDFKSSGGHYNPTGAAHGIKMDGGPHVGDMMNIDVGADLTGTLTVVNERVSITGGNGLSALFDSDGTALIIHERADDYITQPTGAAGGRVGCALITPQ